MEKSSLDFEEIERGILSDFFSVFLSFQNNFVKKDDAEKILEIINKADEEKLKEFNQTRTGIKILFIRYLIRNEYFLSLEGSVLWIGEKAIETKKEFELLKNKNYRGIEIIYIDKKLERIGCSKKKK